MQSYLHKIQDRCLSDPLPPPRPHLAMKSLYLQSSWCNILDSKFTVSRIPSYLQQVFPPSIHARTHARTHTLHSHTITLEAVDHIQCVGKGTNRNLCETQLAMPSAHTIYLPYCGCFYAVHTLLLTTDPFLTGIPHKPCSRGTRGRCRPPIWQQPTWHSAPYHTPSGTASDRVLSQ